MQCWRCRTPWKKIRRLLSTCMPGEPGPAEEQELVSLKGTPLDELHAMEDSSCGKSGKDAGGGAAERVVAAAVGEANADPDAAAHCREECGPSVIECQEAAHCLSERLQQQRQALLQLLAKRQLPPTTPAVAAAAAALPTVAVSPTPLLPSPMQRTRPRASPAQNGRLSPSGGSSRIPPPPALRLSRQGSSPLPSPLGRQGSNPVLEEPSSSEARPSLILQLEASHQKALQEQWEQHLQELEATEARHHQLLAEVETRYAQALAAAQRQHAGQLAAAQRHHEQQLAAAKVQQQAQQHQVAQKGKEEAEGAELRKALAQQQGAEKEKEEEEAEGAALRKALAAAEAAHRAEVEELRAKLEAAMEQLGALQLRQQLAAAGTGLGRQQAESAARAGLGRQQAENPARAVLGRQQVETPARAGLGRQQVVSPARTPSRIPKPKEGYEIQVAAGPAAARLGRQASSKGVQSRWLGRGRGLSQQDVRQEQEQLLPKGERRAAEPRAPLQALNA